MKSCFYVALTLLMVIIALTSSAQNVVGTATDIDGNLYNVVHIGTQYWTQSNLATTHFQNGDTIAEVEDSASWAELYYGSPQAQSTPAWCIYDGNAAYNAAYGKLYTWYAASDPRNACPVGWHVSSGEDWNVLLNYLGTPPNTVQLPAEFAALSGGFRNAIGAYWDAGSIGYFWPSDSRSATPDQAYYMYTQNGLWIMSVSIWMQNGNSIRCVGGTIPIPTVSTNSPACGSTLNLTAYSIAGATYNWTGPNGFSSSVQNPSISHTTMADSGTYYVTAMVNGLTSDTGSVNVVIRPTTAPMAGSNSPVCKGNTLNLTASTVAGANYNWTGPNGFSASVQNTTISQVITADSGTYYVSAAINGCKSDSGTVNVIINYTTAPVAGSNSPVHTGDTLKLTASTVAGANYHWTGPNGFTDTSQNPNIFNVTLADSGTYYVVATANGCTSDSGRVNVTILPASSSLKIFNQNSSTGKTILLKGPISVINNDSVKICADGSMATRFVYFNANAPSVVTSGIQFIVTDLNNNTDQFQLGYVTRDTISNDTIYATMHHPTYVASNYTPSRLAYLSIIYNTELCRIYLPIYRAPVVFVHGLNANYTTFQNMADSLALNNLYPATHPRSLHVSPLIWLVDYTFTNTDHFFTNRAVARTGISSVLGQAVNAGYSCGSAIVVGHSMGGVLARLYLQQAYGIKYRNDIQKLITINTPHYGTQLATYGLAFGATGTVENEALKLLIDALSEEVDAPPFISSFAGDLVTESINNFFANNGAFQDLSDTSYATTHVLNISQASQIYKVPSVTLSTNWFGTYDPYALLYGGLISNGLYCGEENDLIVPVPSQQAGIILEPTVLGQWHVGSPDNNTIISQVIGLINSNPINNSYFTQNGFVQGSLCSPHLVLPYQNPYVRGISTDSVKILNPTLAQVFNQGDTVRVNIYSVGSITRLLLAVTGNTILPISFDTTDVAQLQFVIPNTVLGQLNLTLLAGDSALWYASDTTSIIVNSAIAPDSIVCNPKQASIALGLTQRIAVEGYFSGNAINLNGLPALALVYDTNYLITQGNNVFQARDTGTTTVVFTYIGKKDSAVITIYNDPTALSTTFDLTSDEICAGGNITFTPHPQGLATAQHWSFPGGNPDSSTANNPLVTYAVPGVYSAMLITTFVNGTDTASIDSIIFVSAQSENPVVTQFGSALTCTTGSSYQWYRSADSLTFTSIANATSDTLALTSNGYYYVMVTDNNGCTESSTPVYYSTNGVRLIGQDNSIVVYPNPSAGVFNLQINSAIKTGYEISIYNVMGQVVYSRQEEMGAGLNTIVLQTTNLAAGAYLLRVRSGEAEWHKDIVKD